MIDENKETHYYNMKVSSWDEHWKAYGIYFQWKLLLLFMSLLGFRFFLSGLSGLSIHVYIKYLVYGTHVPSHLKSMA